MVRKISAFAIVVVLTSTFAINSPHPKWTIEFQESADYCDSYWDGDKRKDDLEILCGGHSSGKNLSLCINERTQTKASTLPVLIVDRLSDVTIENLGHFFQDVLWGMASFLALCIPSNVRFNCHFLGLPQQHYYRSSYEASGPAFFVRAVFANICDNQSFELVQPNNTNTTSVDNTIHVSHPINKRPGFGIRPWAFGNTSKDIIYGFFQRGADALVRSKFSEDALKIMNPLDDSNSSTGDIDGISSIPLPLVSDRYQANVVSFPYSAPSTNHTHKLDPISTQSTTQREVERGYEFLASLNKEGPVHAALKPVIERLQSQYGKNSPQRALSVTEVTGQKFNVIVYSREDASNHRKLLNAMKICEWLREKLLPPERYGVSLVRKLTNMTDSTRYLLFKNSHVFIAAHGGYSPNTLFMPPSSLWFDILINEESFREWDFSLHSSKYVQVIAMTDDIKMAKTFKSVSVPIKRFKVDQHPGYAFHSLSLPHAP